MSLVKITIPITSSVYSTSTSIAVPIKEFHSDLESVDIRKVRPVQRNEDVLTSGNFVQLERFNNYTPIHEDYWESGVIGVNSCQLIELDFSIVDRIEIEPIVDSGWYRYKTEKAYLYPNHSVATKLYELEFTVDSNETHPISLAIFTRNQYKEPVVHREVLFVDEFLPGLLEEGRGSGQQVDQYRYDFFTGEYILNQVVEEQFPRNTVPFDAGMETGTLCEYLDFLGVASGQPCEGFYTKYFPLDWREDSGGYYSPVLIVIAPDADYSDMAFDTFDFWNPVNDIRAASPEDKVFEIDADLGIYHLGGKLGEDTELLQEFDSDDRSYISVLDPDKCPSKGLIRIVDGDRTISAMYKGKENHRLIIEAMEGESGIYPKGSKVIFEVTGAVPIAGSKLYAAYRAIPRLEYVEKVNTVDSVKRFTKSSSLTTLKNNESFLVIDRSVPQELNVTLEAMNLDTISISGVVYYGPVSFTSEVVLLRGRVTNSNGEPVGDAEVVVEVLEGPGLFYGETSISLTSDSDGYFYTTLYGDRSVLFRAAYARTVVYEEVEGQWFSYLDFNYPEDILGLTSNIDLLSLYVVTKDDEMLGTVGKYYQTPKEKYQVTDGFIFDACAIEYTNLYSDITRDVAGDIFGSMGSFVLIGMTDEVDPSYLEGGTVTIAISLENFVDGTEATRLIERNIIKCIRYSEFWNDADVEEEASVRHNTWLVIVDERITGKYIREMWLRSKHDILWDPVSINGRKSVIRIMEGQEANDPEDYLVDASSSDWVNPESDEITVTWKPVTPEAFISGSRFRFIGKLPAPEVSNIRSNIGAYCLFLDKTTKVRAKAKDEYCVNKWYYSNVVNILLTASNSQQGNIPLSNGSIVPVGYRLPGVFDYSSALSGPVYLTLNSSRRRATSDVLSFEDFFNVPKLNYINDTISYEVSDEVNPYNNYISYTITITNT
jgi:hypothetical protein